MSEEHEERAKKTESKQQLDLRLEAQLKSFQEEKLEVWEFIKPNHVQVEHQRKGPSGV